MQDHSAVRPGEVLPSDQLTEYHLIRLGECQCDTGLEVTGSDVTVYGLQVDPLPDCCSDSNCVVASASLASQKSRAGATGAEAVR